MSIEPRCISDYRCVLGENPLWDPSSQRLFVIDCMSRLMFSQTASGDKVEQWKLPRTPGSFALRQAGGMLMAYRRGLALIDLATDALQDVASPIIDFNKAVFNDGKCDRRGRFWTGTMDREIASPIGGLYRVDPDLSVHRMGDGITLSNGIAWSPDNKTMFHCDSRPGLVWAYDYDIDTGSISNRRIFVDFSGREGHPDGCTMDAEGGLWIAEIPAGQIVRFAPDGTQTATIKTPVTRPTSVMFGGPDLRTLFITSMRYGLTDDERAQQPQAGGVFAVDAGVGGLPEAVFAG